MPEERNARDRTRSGKRATRGDSVRNREKLIAAAQKVFAEDGLNASLDKVARQAAVGPGTLYRHFPTRVDLWDAVLEQPLRDHLQLVRRAVENPNRWDGVADYITASCAMEAERNGYLNLMTTRYDGAPELMALRAEIQRSIEQLIRAARDQGAIRSDFTTEDLIFIMLSNSRIAEVTRAIAPTAWRRNVELFLQAMRPECAQPLSERPMTPREVDRSMNQPRGLPARKTRRPR